MNFVYVVIEHTVYGINRHSVQLGAEILNDLHVIWLELYIVSDTQPALMYRSSRLASSPLTRTKQLYTPALNLALYNYNNNNYNIINNYDITHNIM